MQNRGNFTKFIEELKQKCDIVSTISRFISLQRKGKTYWACCPFHHEKTPSFAINEVEQYYHCYGCGESGDVIKFIEKYENLTFMEAVKYLADMAGLKMPEFEGSAQDLKQLKLKSDCLNAAALAMNFYKNNLNLPVAEKARAYLAKRELDKNIVDYFNIGFSPDWTSLIDYLQKNNVSREVMKAAGLIDTSESGKVYDSFATRLIFPILNSYGDCIGFTARTLEADAKFAKYKNSTQTLIFDKSKTIYNIHSLKQLRKEQNIDYIIICEGTIDVIAMYKAGFKNTVACMGTAITSFHARELKKYADKIILCLDGDEAGQNATYKAIDVLGEQGLEVKVVCLKENLDPDEFLKKYGKQELINSLNNAEDAIEYKLSSLSKKFNLNDSFQKNKYIANALDIISNLDSNSQKEIYLKFLSKKVNISIDVLRRDLFGSTYKTSSQAIKEELAQEDKFVVRQDGHLKALKFIVASIIHKQPYAIDAVHKNLKFKNSNYQNLYDFVVNSYNQNKPYTISSLFDVFDVDNNADIKEIIDYDFSVYPDKETYFDECYNKITLINLKQKQEDLTQRFKTETDLDKRREIANELYKITKEIKTKTEKKQ
ncbi:MAG: DNA primase [Clostridia bacterium]|nr:DNA primase [Clostridia bacterium]